ncbi:hypothetical protein GLOTRDRAFT_75766 [Gloeophyllum trabeum ATCC 11539]|uniref:Multiple RNA-binding domain-containing protein 1 n=1 Tax=Gloeophyllum trabeum (strain ATCC 11539 / FP-39264 / Madison 617) TaxID=670483 RepID=S7Q6C4_GLOTA|nr:uncharacterized protein GLOTRDRAFT_75766 [Gloeophyllum trabeum ATCC 11539]EPQ55616.1 hypothetical protein GLOTRDRAFT_75766 [Gloeophyllum trabeum ATCC 11539]
MSRLIVKNLPPYATPTELKSHFLRKDGPGGTITDVKVAFKKDGTSRRFGFVGFKTEGEAQKARDWFDKTFLGSSRLSVAGVKDAPAPRPNKRPRLGPSPHEEGGKPAPKEKKAKETGDEQAKEKKSGKKEKQLEEFMKVMQPRTKGRTWADDVTVTEPAHPSSDQTKPKKKDKKKKAEDVEMHDAERAGGDEEPKEEGISDLEWMKRRMKAVAVEEKVFEQSDEENVDEEEDPEEEDQTKGGKDMDPNRGTIMQTSRLFVRNLAFSCTEDELRDLFQQYGEVNQVHLPLDTSTKQPKGFAYVSFAQPTSAVAAYEALDGRSFQGRLLHILAAVDRKGKVQVEEGEGKKKSVKDEKEEKRKALAGKGFNWSMLYMNSDAVVSSVADRMNVSKADILNPESDNAAVKLALAETHVIQETKSYLEAQGVVLSSFSSRARSDTIILVKNIPYGTTAEQIRELFEPHGELARVLVPPAGTMAVVEYIHADEASKGFRAVAYRRLGNSIIYLEKGPLGMFQETAEEVKKKAGGPVTSTAVAPVKISEQDAPMEGEPPLAAGSTLFVKNLAFSTTAERLTQVFRNLNGFAFARVQTKPDPKNPGGPRLSMGYGFVGFKTPEAAKQAIKGMQGYVLDGHALSVKFAGRGAEEEQSGGKSAAKAHTTKMIVKNVPFEATKKDIRQLFGSHGQLKSVRLPRKFDHRSRGFAFLEFVTRHEAENAYNALRHTHLLGRHLVLEWAEEGEQDIDELRKKAGVGYGGGKELPGRKRKLELGDEDAGDAGGGEED